MGKKVNTNESYRISETRRQQISSICRATTTLKSIIASCWSPTYLKIEEVKPNSIAYIMLGHGFKYEQMPTSGEKFHVSSTFSSTTSLREFCNNEPKRLENSCPTSAFCSSLGSAGRGPPKPGQGGWDILVQWAQRQQSSKPAGVHTSDKPPVPHHTIIRAAARVSTPRASASSINFPTVVQ